MLLQTIAITSDTTNATNKRVVTGTKVTTELIEAQWFLQTALKSTDADVTKDTTTWHFNADTEKFFTVRTEVPRHSFLILGISDFFSVVYSIRSANVGIIFKHNSCRKQMQQYKTYTYIYFQSWMFSINLLCISKLVLKHKTTSFYVIPGISLLILFPWNNHCLHYPGFGLERYLHLSWF